MNETNRFSLMIDSLTELAEVEQTRHASPTPVPGLPTLASVIADASPLPREALFLGLAEDGLPVLLNLHDPIPGPMLICADKTSGKTAFQQMIIRGVEMLHTPDDVQSVIITQHPDEWEKFQGRPNTAGIYATQEDTTQKLLQSLVAWAHNNRGDGQSILLLIDDLESLTKIDQATEQNLRWLLLRGPSRRVWPIVTLNPGRAKYMEEWLVFFRTRFFGSIQDSADANFLTGGSDTFPDHLIAGSEFAMREGSKWLKFWKPVIDQ